MRLVTITWRIAMGLLVVVIFLAVLDIRTRVTGSVVNATAITLSKWEPIVEISSEHRISIKTSPSELRVYECKPPSTVSDVLGESEFYSVAKWSGR